MLSQVEKLQLKNEVQRVLHVPGNYRGGILEMAIVIDHALPPEYVEEALKDLVQTLKQTDEIFRNVRLNVIDWFDDEHMEKKISGLPMLQMSSYYEGYIQEDNNEKRLEILAGQLKLFYARSKLMILLTKKREEKNSAGNPAPGINNIDKWKRDCYQIKDEAVFRENMKPFLERKLILFP